MGMLFDTSILQKQVLLCCAVVRAKVIKIDRETQKLSLGLKPSYFEGEEAEDEEPDVAADDMDTEAFEAAAEVESGEEDTNLGKGHGSVE